MREQVSLIHDELQLKLLLQVPQKQLFLWFLKLYRQDVCPFLLHIHKLFFLTSRLAEQGYKIFRLIFLEYLDQKLIYAVKVFLVY